MCSNARCRKYRKRSPRGAENPRCVPHAQMLHFARDGRSALVGRRSDDDIPHQPVVRRIEHIVQRDRKLDGARFDDRCPPVWLTESSRNRRSSCASCAIAAIKLAQLARIVDRVQQVAMDSVLSQIFISISRAARAKTRSMGLTADLLTQCPRLRLYGFRTQNFRSTTKSASWRRRSARSPNRRARRVRSQASHRRASSPAHTENTDVSGLVVLRILAGGLCRVWRSSLPRQHVVDHLNASPMHFREMIEPLHIRPCQLVPQRAPSSAAARISAPVLCMCRAQLRQRRLAPVAARSNARPPAIPREPAAVANSLIISSCTDASSARR